MLYFVITLLIIFGVMEVLSLRKIDERLDYELSLSVSLCDPDEPFELVSEIRNKGRLPVTYIRLIENVPVALRVDMEGGNVRLKWEGEEYGAEATQTSAQSMIQSTFFLLPERVLRRRLNASLPARGRYLFKDSRLEAGDFLGFRRRVLTFHHYRELIVAPRPCEDVAFIHALGGILGDISARRFIFEDPVLTLGFREYTGREPMKHISWKRSAASAELMVKNFDYTLEPSAVVLLNVELPSRGVYGHLAEDTEAIERSFSIARAVCEQLESRRVQYSFASNALTAGEPGYWSKLRAGLGAKHIATILEGLGRASRAFCEPFDALLGRAVSGARQGLTHIIISVGDVNRYAEPIVRLRARSGRAVVTISTDCEVRQW